ncbi:hypothetical protein NG54_17970 [Heyndrickxia ginsengihumi]|uniref:Uncharacterized protein n=1 Tax=Heyndrickxia ginsengihumi TaxID=363870 RepID=A0A0A6V7N2_9BACI|nr:hypothetical protein NG54_17970 [Heyndrickxia ginsengihumi]
MVMQLFFFLIDLSIVLKASFLAFLTWRSSPYFYCNKLSDKVKAASRSCLILYAKEFFIIEEKCGNDEYLR